MKKKAENVLPNKPRIVKFKNKNKKPIKIQTLIAFESKQNIEWSKDEKVKEAYQMKMEEGRSMRKSMEE